MKDFFDTWKFKILIAIAVFLVGIMAYAGANGRLTAAPQELLSVAVAPFQRAAAAVSSGVASLWENYANIDAILEENQQLSEENASLRSQMVDYDKLKAENEAYKALANIQEQHPEMSYTSSLAATRWTPSGASRWTEAHWTEWPSTTPSSATRAICWAWCGKPTSPAARS